MEGFRGWKIRSINKSNRIKPVDIETDQTGNRSAQRGAPVAKSIFAKRTQNSVPNQALIKIGPTN
jgi:hypothetical protein